MYLLGVAELAIYSFFKRDFAMTRPRPLPESWQGIVPGMAYVTGALILIAVLLILLTRQTPAALLGIALMILLMATSRHVWNLWRDHINGLKSLWLIGGALLVLSSLGGYDRYRRTIWLFNIVVLFLFFVDCGVAHFLYTPFVRELIPTFIPFRLFFTYFAGVCLVLGGAGLLIPATRKLAALLAGIMVAGWFVLLHIPRALTIGVDEWIGVGESLAVAGICFMLYAMEKSIEEVPTASAV
jgi:uncharacterized membrane protein